jgi:hypothetical protein
MRQIFENRVRSTQLVAYINTKERKIRLARQGINETKYLEAWASKYVLLVSNPAQ